MARMIDADTLQELCNRKIQDTWNSGVAPVSWAEAYADFKNDIDSMSTLTPPNEWVSVDERLPTPGERVIATDGQFVGEGYFDSCCGWFRYGGFEWRFFDVEGDVTHWMPLPEPPVKE